MKINKKSCEKGASTGSQDLTRKTIQGILATAFLSTFGVGAFTFVLSLKAGTVGLSSAWLGLAFSGYFLARCALAPLAGYGADYFGAMPLLLMATGTGAIIPALYCFFPSTEIFWIIQFCFGLCIGIVKPVSMSFLGECVTRDRRGRFFGAYNTCLYSAFVFGPLAGGATVGLQDELGLPVLIWPFLGMCVSFLLLLRGRRISSRGQGVRRKRNGVPWGDARFITLLLAVLGRTTGASVMITFLPRIISENYVLSGFWSGFLFTIPNLVIVLAMPVTGKWSDIRDRSGLTFLGMGLCAACLFGLGQPVSIVGFFFLATIMGFGSAVSLPASMSLAADLESARGGVMGIFLAASNLGFIFGPALAGFAAERGSMADAFELTALFSALCLLPTFILMARKLHAE
ncbi:MFS transporter [Maridesulfovibrio sp. FT414]|uniref:MFS transporter n=1 Tax=Maridesulfovibrio sp. FT414 TaxID=2979469 RepID=UPI003D80A0A5